MSFEDALHCLASLPALGVEAWWAARALPRLRRYAVDWLLRALLPEERRHPIAALTTTADPLRRTALRVLLFTQPKNTKNKLAPRGGIRSMAEFIDPVRGPHADRIGRTYTELIPKYHAALAAIGRDPTARTPSERGPYTLQVARVAGGGDERIERFFLSLRTADELLAFFVQWYALQLTSPPSQRIMLCECGTHDRALRKWVIDVDAKVLELEAQGFSTDPDVLLPEVLDLGESIGRLLTRRCPFAVVSRHSAKTRSWHLTLCALAPLDEWREAMAAILPRLEDRMARFIDPGTLRNSRGQFIQVWGSTKPSRSSSNCFLWEGLWANATTPIALPEDDAAHIPLFFAATSLMLHDPWSRPLRRSASLSFRLDLVEGVLKARGRSSSRQGVAAARQPQAPKPIVPVASSVEWTALPPDGAWMREFIDHGGARLSHVPSMDNRDYWPQPVLDAEVYVHAHVRGASVCPRFLLSKRQLHSHQRNAIMLFCFRHGTHPPRMLMRCFSEKCRALPLPTLEASRYVSKSGWLEVLPDDLRAVRLLRGGHGRQDTTKVPPPDRLPAWVHRLAHERLGLDSLQGAPPLVPLLSLPPCMLRGARVRNEILHHVEVVSAAACDAHAAAQPKELLLVSETDARCPGRSIRLFVRCTHPDCAAQVRAPDTGAWMELKRAAV